MLENVLKSLENSAKSHKSLKEDVVAVRKHLEDYEKFLKKADTNGNCKKLKSHQIRRIFEPYRLDGNKRIMFGDCTGSGKTIVGLGIIDSLNEKYKRKIKTLLVAPEIALLGDTWRQERVDKYCEEFGLSPNKIFYIDKPKDLDKIKNKIPENIDIVALNYFKLGISKGDNRYIASLENICDQFDMFLLDECQNMVNPCAYRVNAFERIIKKTFDKYFVLLSAFPIPNELEDAGVILHYLEPWNPDYPLATYDHKSKPGAINYMRLKGKWFSFPREHLREIFKDMPPLPSEEVVVVKMNDVYGMEYFETWISGEISSFDKIHRMMKTSALSISDCLEKILRESEFKNKNGEIVKLEENTQLAAQCYHIDIVDGIYNLLNKIEKYSGKIERVDGRETNVEKRVKIIEDFNKGKIKGIVRTGVAGAGISSSTGYLPLLLINTELPFTPGEDEQNIGRYYRPETRAKVTILSLLSKNDEVSRMMEQMKEHLEKEYKVKFPSDWKPSFFTFDGYDRLNLKKSLLSNKALYGLEFSDYEEAIMKKIDFSSRASVEEAVKNRVFRGFIPADIIKDCMKRGFSVNNLFNSMLYGKPLNDQIEASRHKGKYAIPFERELAMYFNAEEWPYTTSADASRLITSLISGIEEDNPRKFGKILDVGSGNACLARILKRPLINFDLSREMLDEGKRLCKELDLKSIKGGFREMQYIEGIVQDMKFDDESFDLVNSCFSIMYAGQYFDNDENKHYREIEDGIIEVNRVLKEGGYYFITLPGGRPKHIAEKEFEDLIRALEKYNFRVLADDFFKGYTKGKKREGIFGAYFLAAQKSGRCNGYAIEPGEFCMYPPYGYSATGGYKGISLAPVENLRIEVSRAGKKLKSEEFIGQKNRSLDELIVRLR